MEWLIENWIPKNSLGVIAAPPQMFKTKLALYLQSLVPNENTVFIFNSDDCAHCMRNGVMPYYNSDKNNSFFCQPPTKDFSDILEKVIKVKEKVNKINELYIFDGYTASEKDILTMKDIVSKYNIEIVFIKTTRKDLLKKGQFGSNILISTADYRMFIDFSLKMNAINVKREYKDFGNFTSTLDIVMHPDYGVYLK